MVQYQGCYLLGSFVFGFIPRSAAFPFSLPGFFHLLFPSSILPSSQLLSRSSQLPGLHFPPLFVLPLPAFDVLLLSCRLFLSLTLLRHSKATLSFHLIFPYSHSPISYSLLCVPLFSCIAPRFCHSTLLLPMHCNAPPFTPLIAFCSSFFHLASPPPVLSTAATKTPPPRNVSMDHLLPIHSHAFILQSGEGKQHNCVYFTNRCWFQNTSSKPSSV